MMVKYKQREISVTLAELGAMLAFSVPFNADSVVEKIIRAWMDGENIVELDEDEFMVFLMVWGLIKSGAKIEK